MNLKRNYKKHAKVSGSIMVMAFAFNHVDPDRNLVTVGCLALIWFTFVMVRYHKCPGCRKPLPLFDFKGTRCRRCGCPLDDDWEK